MATPRLETARLILEPLASEDAAQIQRIFPRWEIVRYLIASVPWPYPDDAAQQYVDNVALASSREGKGWYWTLRRKASPQTLMGVICLMDIPDNNRGFWLAPEWQGQGYMMEACRAVTDFWFNVLDRDVLRAPKAAINTRSRHISERSGMRLVRLQKGDYVAGELETELWEITREEWRNMHR
ncbi:Protein N-acetyltransferase, RimJ/RimL family [Kosakonia oryzendophytica]|uniref:Protein N-acetyltransferase, RimJ/RimL family n=1 Tax=Kosakonia oryzendophytica TaxID=1005665 RepID=A0A1C4AMK3_9ENTR|nr:GNAT family N-acetyltransferase [Kosakonia oryzendophytica]AMO50246.1 acetyltransferase [Enterobacter sp. FY-07]WBT57228.1 GNAT family N-acetyltransferase [Kosakonia oryzendophytica]SCB95815.1 Protein N-acetyltransferase, RimJ/RimL family [Kosakonia oryzendophytica]